MGQESEKLVMDKSEDLKEIERLRFILDKQNRYPGCLGDNEERKLLARLSRLERKYSESNNI